jgi:hypothetical protein
MCPLIISLYSYLLTFRNTLDSSLKKVKKEEWKPFSFFGGEIHYLEVLYG